MQTTTRGKRTTPVTRSAAQGDSMASLFVDTEPKPGRGMFLGLRTEHGMALKRPRSSSSQQCSWCSSSRSSLSSIYIVIVLALTLVAIGFPILMMELIADKARDDNPNFGNHLAESLSYRRSRNTGSSNEHIRSWNATMKKTTQDPLQPNISCSSIPAITRNGLHLIEVATTKEADQMGTRPPKILCFIMTHSGHHKTRVKAVWDTWGPKCDKLIMASNKTDPSIGAIEISSGTPNHDNSNGSSSSMSSYSNLWMKLNATIRYLWIRYINNNSTKSINKPKSGHLSNVTTTGYNNLREHSSSNGRSFMEDEDFDWFFKIDDDTYVIMENLIAFLSSPTVQSKHMKGEMLCYGRRFSWPPLQHFVQDTSLTYVQQEQEKLSRLEWQINSQHEKRQRRQEQQESPGQDILDGSAYNGRKNEMPRHHEIDSFLPNLPENEEFIRHFKARVKDTLMQQSRDSFEEPRADINSTTSTSNSKLEEYYPYHHLIYNAGGAGYVMNRAYMNQLYHVLYPYAAASQESADPKIHSVIHTQYRHNSNIQEDPNKLLLMGTPPEDLAHGLVMWYHGIYPQNSRDELQKERFHPELPHTMYRLPKSSYLFPYHDQHDLGGIQSGDNCCSTHSITFHHAKEKHMRYIHSQLYDELGNPKIRTRKDSCNQ